MAPSPPGESPRRGPTTPRTLWTATGRPPAVRKPLPPRQASGAFSTTSTRAPTSRAESAAHMAALPPPTTMTSCAAGTAALPDDLADLNLRLDVRVVRDVAHDLLAVLA